MMAGKFELLALDQFLLHNAGTRRKGRSRSGRAHCRWLRDRDWSGILRRFVFLFLATHAEQAKLAGRDGVHFVRGRTIALRLGVLGLRAGVLAGTVGIALLRSDPVGNHLRGRLGDGRVANVVVFRGLAVRLAAVLFLPVVVVRRTLRRGTR